MRQIFVISFLAILLAYAKASEMTMNQWCSACDVDNSNISFPTCCEVDKDFHNDCNSCKCVLLSGEKTPIASCTKMGCTKKSHCDPKFVNEQKCCQANEKYTFDGKEYQCNRCGLDAVKLS